MKKQADPQLLKALLNKVDKLGHKLWVIKYGLSDVININNTMTDKNQD